MSKALTVLVIHADEQRVRDLYRVALEPLGRIDMHFVNRNGLSARYDGTTGLAYEYPTVRKLLSKVAKGWAPSDPLLGIGFSAGCWALRAWLRNPECRKDFSCVMFLDGLHAALDGQRRVVETQLQGVYAYADECRASNGSKLLIQQNTDIQTELYHPAYASTSMTARALLDHLKVERRNAPDDGETAGVVVRTYGGKGAAAHVHALTVAGPELITQEVVPFFSRLLPHDTTSQENPTTPEPWRDPRLTLGQRCVLLCQHELATRVRANPTGPNTGPNVSKYFGGAIRNGKPLGVTAGNWCMLAQSWVLEQCLLPGETAPHQWRAGVVEAVEDAKAGKLYHPVAEVQSGVFRPSTGDLAIWDRSVPGDASTSWWRHVNRVVVVSDRSTPRSDDDVFEAIGGNEGNRTWVSALRRMSDARLLGFIEYPRSAANDEIPPGEQWVEHDSTEDPVHVEAVEPTLRGIDVSHHQGIVDYPKVGQRGHSWVMCRATYGARPDESFARNWKDATSAGLRVSAYHFLRYKHDQPAEAQIDAFLTALSRQCALSSLAMPVALDVEANPTYDDPLEFAKYVELVKSWLARVTEATSTPPLVYTSSGFWDTLPGVESISRRHPLWVAHYTSAARPTLPKGWNDYRIWQFTSAGRIDGISRSVNLNLGQP